MLKCDPQKLPFELLSTIRQIESFKKFTNKKLVDKKKKKNRRAKVEVKSLSSGTVESVTPATGQGDSILGQD